jgi:NitT/TauT family transport system permease protein
VREAGKGPAVLRALQAAWIRPLLLLVILVVLRDLVIRVFHIPPYEIPTPLDVMAAFRDGWPELLSQAVPTAYAKIAVAPLLVVWFGFDTVPKIILAFLLAVFPIVAATVQGFKSIAAHPARDRARPCC